MATLEELRKEKARLLNEQQARDEMEAIGRERKSLEKDIRNLRNPGKVKLVRAIKQTGRGFGIMGKGLFTGVKKGIEGYARATGQTTIWDAGKKVKRVRKVKRRR